MPDEGEITRLLRDIEAGRDGAMDKLMTLVYDDLERMAGSYLRKHYGDQAGSITLEPAALVNESFLKLIKQRNPYDNRGHFFAIASRMMFRVLIADRRRRDALMRGGGGTHITLVLDENLVAGQEPDTAIIEIEQFAEALEKLEGLSPRKADIVKMRVLWGLSIDQISASLETSPSTVDRDWRFARAWLAAEVNLAEP